MYRSRTFDVAGATLAVLLITTWALYAHFFIKGDDLEIRTFYDIYDAANGAIARWWQPLKVRRARNEAN